MSGHTPGPWKVSRCEVWAADDSRPICNVARDCDPEPDETMANARLIAAAPDILAALEAVFMGIFMPPGLYGAVQDAIAKAKGETPDA